jgi:hypothetical protein
MKRWQVITLGCAAAAPTVVLGAGLAAVLYVVRSVDATLSERLSRRPWDDDEWPVSTTVIDEVAYLDADGVDALDRYFAEEQAERGEDPRLSEDGSLRPLRNLPDGWGTQFGNLIALDPEDEATLTELAEEWAASPSQNLTGLVDRPFSWD